MNGRYFIKVGGQKLPPEVEVTGVYFEYESNDELLDRVILRFKSKDGKLLDSYFPHGADLEFQHGPQEGAISEPRIFTIRQVEGSRNVTVTAYEPGHRLTNNSRSKIYRNVTIDEVAAQKAMENGLAFVGDSFPLRYIQLAQANESDMRFLKRQAKRANAAAYRERNTLFFVKKTYQGDPVATFVIDDNGGFDRGKAIAFRPIERNLGLAWEVTYAGMDPLTLEPYEAKANGDTVHRTVLGQDTILFDGAAGPAARTGQTGIRHYSAARNPLQAKQEAEAAFMEQEAGMVRATVQLWGNPEVLTNRLIRLTGVIERWAGLYRVTKARHIIDGGGPYKILAEIERNATGTTSGGKSTGGTAVK